MNETKFTPVGDRLLVLRDQQDSQTAAGILIPDAAKKQQLTGVIVDVGDEVKNKRLVVGFRVMFTSYAGHALIFDGKEYLALAEAEIIGIMEGT